MIPFQIDMMHAQQDRITNSEIHILLPAVLPLRLMLLHMPKGYLHLLHLLNSIALVLLCTFVWMHNPQYIHYSPNTLPINQLKGVFWIESYMELFIAYSTNDTQETHLLSTAID